LLPPPTFSLTHTPTTHIYTLSLHDALPIFVFHRQQLVALALHHLGHRDAGRTRYHLGDLLGTDFGAQHAVLGLIGRSLGLGRLLKLRLQLRQLAVLQLGHLLPVALARRLFHLQPQLLDLFLDVLATLHLRLFGLPYLLEVGVFAFQPRYLFLDQGETFLRTFILFL